MNRILTTLLCASLLLFTACSKSPDQLLVGTWALDLDATVASMGEEVSEEEGEEMRRDLEDRTMNITFDSDGNVTMAMGDDEEAFLYEVVSTGESSVTIGLSEEGDEEDVDEMTVNFSGNDSLTVELRGTDFTFARQ